MFETINNFVYEIINAMFRGMNLMSRMPLRVHVYLLIVAFLMAYMGMRIFGLLSDITFEIKESYKESHPKYLDDGFNYKGFSDAIIEFDEDEEDEV